MVKNTLSEARRRAEVYCGEVLCPEDGKLLARVTREGVLLWCRAGRHEVLLPRELITKYFESP